MNEMIKDMALTLLEDAQDIVNSIDLENRKEDICEQLDEINHLIEKAKTGTAKIKI